MSLMYQYISNMYVNSISLQLFHCQHVGYFKMLRITSKSGICLNYCVASSFQDPQLKEEASICTYRCVARQIEYEPMRVIYIQGVLLTKTFQEYLDDKKSSIS